MSIIQHNNKKNNTITTLTININNTKLTTTLINTNKQIHNHRKLPTPTNQTPKTLHNTLSTLISPLQTHTQQITITSTKIIHNNNLLTLNPHNLNKLLHFPLIKTLKQLTNLPTITINNTQTTT